MRRASIAYALDPWMLCDPLVVVILLVDTARVGPHKTPLHRPQIGLVGDEAEQDGLEASRAGVVLLVRVGRRCHHGVNGLRFDELIHLARVCQKYLCGRLPSAAQDAQVVRHPLQLC